MCHNYLRIISLCFFAGVAALILKCSSASTIAGTATQSGNGIVTGMVVYGDGVAATGSNVSLHKSSYDPVSCTTQCFSRLTVVNNAGKFTFDTLPADIYTIEITSTSGLKALHFDIVVANRVTKILSPDTLKHAGILNVRIPDSLVFNGAYVYVPGTSIKGYVDTFQTDNGSIRIDSVAAGVLPSLYFRIPGSLKAEVDTNDIQIIENDTTYMNFESDDSLYFTE